MNIMKIKDLLLAAVVALMSVGMFVLLSCGLEIMIFII